MAKTKKPSGMVIVRDGNVFVVSWKIGDANYSDGQQFQYKISNQKKWKHLGSSSNIGKKATSQKFTFPVANYYPTTGKTAKATSISFRVRGNRGSYKSKGKTIRPEWSDWTEKTFKIEIPTKPSISSELSSDFDNVTIFTWAANVNDNSKKMFSKIEWQTAFVENNASPTFGSSTFSSNASGSTTQTENNSTINNGKSHKRIVRVRSCGPAGCSEWVQASHVYADPKQSVNISASAAYDGAGINCIVNFNTSSTKTNPIDKIIVQYSKVVPAAGLAFPSGGSWETASTVKYKSGKDVIRFRVDDVLGDDECLFIRANTEHDRNTTYGTPMLALVGTLDEPTGLTVNKSSSGNTYSASVAATNPSNIPDSVLKVYYRNKKTNLTCEVGTIPHGTTSAVTVTCPPWDSASDVDIGVMTYASGNGKSMKSNVVWYAGTDAPTSVTVRQTAISGTVRIGWTNTTTGITGTEIAWADHDDAWESTDEPDTYIIDNGYTTAWNVSGLETGKTWYFRVRSFKDDGDSTLYSVWSEMVFINLSSAPAVPTLSLSNDVIIDGETIEAYWDYVSTDGTLQKYAEIFEITDIGSLSSDYVLTPDTSLKDKDYYVRSGSGTALSPYVYQVKDLKTYVATSDESAVAGKVYYTRSGSGTDASPYVYTMVENPTGTPDNWYEMTNDHPSVSPYSQGLYELNYKTLIRVENSQRVILDPVELEWSLGEVHYLTVQVTSESNIVSEYSKYVTVNVIEAITCAITSTSLISQTVDGRTFNALTSMPLTVEVSGAGNSKNTSVVVERADSYHVERPDESKFDGYEHETILLHTQTGDDAVSFSIEDSIGSLDDGATYRIIASVTDEYGQKKSDEVEFEVHWSHQAIIPLALATVDVENMVAMITPIAPQGADETDVCDIYRLSADRPVLIYPNAVFGKTYVDPYPTLNEHGGHRVVMRTSNNDYITEDNQFAWIDLQENENDYINSKVAVIDFDGDQVKFNYNLDVSHSWDKDFTETRYLGGSVQGDWNPAIGRTGTLSSVAIRILDKDMMEAVRRLASYAGICKVRTPDGTCISADVQVSESWNHDKGQQIAEFNLSFTRVDPEEYEGMTLEEYLSGLSAQRMYSLNQSLNVIETVENGGAGGRTFAVNNEGNLIMTVQDNAVEGIDFSLNNGRLVVEYGD